MYLEHFGLREPPFSITPHTQFFFAGANRGATLDALIYAIVHDEGIVKVSGEVGSGKTMLCRMLLEKLPEEVETVYLAIPSLSREEILHAIAEELGLKLNVWRTHQIMRALQERLLELHASGRRVVVMIDEAHAMPSDTLEEIRLLSNLETNRHKLLHIVLFGQPELDERLSQQHMRQLTDRITHSFMLEPLHRNDVDSYLRLRLRAAGYRGPDIFTAKAVQHINSASQGLTRRINILADKALLAAFAEGKHLIGARLVKTAISDAQLVPMQQKPEKGTIGWIVGTTITVAALAAIGWAAATGVLPMRLQEFLERSEKFQIVKEALTEWVSPPADKNTLKGPPFGESSGSPPRSENANAAERTVQKSATDNSATETALPLADRVEEERK